MSERVFDIKQAAEELGYTAQYVRMLIQDGRLETERIPISPGARVSKYVMTEASLEDFRNTVASRTRRDDSRTKWIIYASFNEMQDLLEANEDRYSEVLATIRPANKLKSMPNWLKERLGDVQEVES